MQNNNEKLILGFLAQARSFGLTISSEKEGAALQSDLESLGRTLSSSDPVAFAKQALWNINSEAACTTDNLESFLDTVL